MNSKSVQFEYNTMSGVGISTNIVDSNGAEGQNGVINADGLFFDCSPKKHERTRQTLRRHNSEPRMTKTTLSELDVSKIVNNPKLQRNINFDPDLHFRPNLDEEKGRRNLMRASDIWETMRNQLRDYLVNPEKFPRARRANEWLLAVLRASPLDYSPLIRNPSNRHLLKRSRLKRKPGFSHRNSPPNDNESIERYQTVYSSKQQPTISLRLDESQCRRGQEDV